MGAAMGGGFAADNSSGSQDAQGAKRSRENDALMPLTIKQIFAATQDAPDDMFMVDGKEAAQVSLVGCVVELVVQSTNISYQLEDGTGRLEVKQWVTEGAEGNETGITE